MSPSVDKVVDDLIVWQKSEDGAPPTTATVSQSIESETAPPKTNTLTKAR
jgi:hypothetical protein